MANTFGKDHEQTKFMIDAYNREVEGLDDVEIWIHTCWGNPNMQRVREDTSYAASIELYLERCKGDIWTVEMKDRNFKDIELFAPFRNDLKKKVAVGVVSHRTLQADRPEEVAAEIRRALMHIPVEQLVVSSDCGFAVRAAIARLPSTRRQRLPRARTSFARNWACRRRMLPPPIRPCRSTSCRSRRRAACETALRKRHRRFRQHAGVVHAISAFHSPEHRARDHRSPDFRAGDHAPAGKWRRAGMAVSRRRRPVCRSDDLSARRRTKSRPEARPTDRRTAQRLCDAGAADDRQGTDQRRLGQAPAGGSRNGSARRRNGGRSHRGGKRGPPLLRIGSNTQGDRRGRRSCPQERPHGVLHLERREVPPTRFWRR